MKLTGERPMQGATPDSLLAFHDAGYREVLARARAGRRRRRRLRRRRRDASASPRPDRLVVGVDYSAETDARRPRPSTRSADGLRFCAMRRRARSALARRQRRLRRLVAHHRALREPGRCTSPSSRACCAPDGTAFVITPERAGRLREPVPRVPVRARAPRVAALALLRRRRRASASKATTCCTPTSRRGARAASACCGSTSSELRRRMPRAAYVWTYERVLPLVYRVLGSDAPGSARACRSAHFFTTEHVDERTPGLFAIARRPRVEGREPRERRRERRSTTRRLGHRPDLRRSREHRAARAPRPRGRARRAHPRRRRQQPRRHRREGRGARRGARRHRGAAPARARWGSAARTAPATRSASRAATTSWSRSTPTSRTTPPTSPACSPRSSGAPTSRSARATCRAAACRTGRGTGSRSRCCGQPLRRRSCLGIGVRDTTAGYRAYRASIAAARSTSTPRTRPATRSRSR